jgi:hypothetical protein
VISLPDIGRQMLSSHLVVISYRQNRSDTTYSDNFIIDCTLGMDDSGSQLPADYHLAQNFPNPFNAATTISYDLPRASHTLLKLYDITGREVVVLVDGMMTAGHHEMNFEAAALPSGVYFYQLKAQDFSAMRKMVLMK